MCSHLFQVWNLNRHLESYKRIRGFLLSPFYLVLLLRERKKSSFRERERKGPSQEFKHPSNYCLLSSSTFFCCSNPLLSLSLFCKKSAMLLWWTSSSSFSFLFSLRWLLFPHLSLFCFLSPVSLGLQSYFFFSFFFFVISFLFIMFWGKQNTGLFLATFQPLFGGRDTIFR